MTSGNPERAKAAMFEVIEKQLRNNDPPETQKTLERLLGGGRSRQEAMRLIACVLATELFHVMKSESPYDHARYSANLERLPELPFDVSLRAPHDP